MALYKIDDFFTSGNDNFISRAGLFPVHNHQWVSQHSNHIEADGNDSSPTPVVYNILAGDSYLWVNPQNQLYADAWNSVDSSAQFTITTVDQDKPSYITIGSMYFADPKIVAANFSDVDRPSQIITSPETLSNNVVTVFQRSGTVGSEAISVTHPFSGAVYYWDINSDDFSVVLSSDSSEVFAFSEQNKS